MGLRFEWDPEKAAANLKKHGVSFEEATTIFAEPFALTISDPDHSEHEARFLDVGLSHKGRLLVVSYTEREDQIRIISTRLASQVEKRTYETKEN